MHGVRPRAESCPKASSPWSIQRPASCEDTRDLLRAMLGPMKAALSSDLDRFYVLLARLSARLGGPRTLAASNGAAGWPERGVYFFFEPGESRAASGAPRIVRVGTHAVSAGSKATLWSRLKQHRGQGAAGGGNHRGSIFRRHVGMALLRGGRFSDTVETWGVGSSAAGDVTAREALLERTVSEYLGRMPFLWLEADDQPNSSSVRSYIEKNSIGLLSRATLVDPPSPRWLGHSAADERIRSSGLWNVNYVGDGYVPTFLDVLEQLVDGNWRPASGPTLSSPSLPSDDRRLHAMESPVLALISCTKTKATHACAASELYQPSTFFRMAFEFARTAADWVLILSAKHGVVRPTDVIEPYEQTLVGASRSERRRWSEMVHAQLKRVPEYAGARSILWFAGENYRDDLLPPVTADGKTCHVPMSGLQQGEQLAWLRAQLDGGAPAQHFERTIEKAPRPVEPPGRPATAPPTADHFRRALLEAKTQARERGASTVDIRAGDLHRVVGGYPGNAHRMPVCCSVMRQEMRAGDRVLAQPPKGAGASLTISYKV